MLKNIAQKVLIVLVASLTATTIFAQNGKTNLRTVWQKQTASVQGLPEWVKKLSEQNIYKKTDGKLVLVKKNPLILTPNGRHNVDGKVYTAFSACTVSNCSKEHLQLVIDDTNENVWGVYTNKETDTHIDINQAQGRVKEILEQAVSNYQHSER